MDSDISWFPLNIPQNAWQVQDADEEVFLLYSGLQSSTSGATNDEDGVVSGLGSVDSRQGELTVRIDVKPSPLEGPAVSASHLRASKRGKSTSKKRELEPLEIQLFQDTTALRSRKGDTGSVLWRASVHLARLLLSQQQFPSDHSLLPSSSLASSHILELGSGTGLLSIVLAPFVAHYTATDLPSLLPLIRKNQTHNLHPSQLAKITVDDLDWVQLHNTPTQLRHKFFSARNVPAQFPLQNTSRKSSNRRTASPINEAESGTERHVDLIIAVDCIYNPSLIAPLLSAINHFAAPPTHATESTSTPSLRATTSPTVLVVLELRAADVTREFIDGWLALPGKWGIWHVPLLGSRFAMWAGRRADATA